MAKVGLDGVQMACKCGWGIKKWVWHMEMGWVISAGHIWPPSLLLGANPVCVWCVCSCKREKSPPVCNPYLSEKGADKGHRAAVASSFVSLYLYVAVLTEQVATPTLLSSRCNPPQPLLLFFGTVEREDGRGGGKKKLWMCQFSLAEASESVETKAVSRRRGKGRRRERKTGKNECLCTCRM